ncbi:unnamed protein product [Rhizophagus irregularis]|nr:unnamed protein product [Rhizophagus irregularis]
MKHLKLRILQTNEMFENILRIDPTLPKNLTTQQQMRKHKPPVEFIETKSNRAYSFQIKNVIKQLAKYVILLECPLIFFKTYNFLPDLPSRDNPDHYETFANMLNKSPKNKNSDANTSSESVVGFDAAARVNKTKGKTTGRFHPVPAQNPFNGNANINIEAEFMNWLQGKYREVMVGTNRDALTVMEGRYL